MEAGTNVNSLRTDVTVTSATFRANPPIAAHPAAPALPAPRFAGFSQILGHVLVNFDILQPKNRLEFESISGCGAQLRFSAKILPRYVTWIVANASKISGLG